MGGNSQAVAFSQGKGFGGGDLLFQGFGSHIGLGFAGWNIRKVGQA
jgi:hypothetical protein